ncbi:MAG: 3-hydroxyacyl-CoA dehydrogenase [Candidatus Omnitrophica bacterium]|nr:3-hydroxyacyl-CoA dehydrogenase [Candidatus Omnitrophota bacterium]
MYIYKAAVVGAGAMGSEIAQAISFAGIPVVLKDVKPAYVEKGMENIRKIYQRRVDRGKMSQPEMEAKLALVSTTTAYDGFQDVDLVIEAVPERMDLKKAVFRDLDAATPPSAMLATNTSALSISELGASTKRPQKVIGMHFFYPAHVMKLVEVIPGLDTSEETLTDIIGFAENLRKLPIKVTECAGFLVNRLLMPYLNEAAFCLQEGAATLKEIDQAMTEFGLPLGPFTLVDTLGLDVCHDVVFVLLDAYGRRMQPAALWEKIFTAKRLGVKSGAGFYQYGEQAGQPDTFLQGAVAEVQRETARTRTPFSALRLLLPMINEAILCLEEHVASASDIDLAMIAGVGFPQSKGGILHYADEVGLDTVLSQLQEFTKQFGDRFWPAPLLKRRVAAGHLGKRSGKGFFTYG